MPGVPVAVYVAAAIAGQTTAITEFLADLSGPVNVLDIGAGTGSFSRALQQTCNHPKNRFYWIDIDAERMETSRNALWFAGAIETIVADLRQETDFPDIPGHEMDVVLAGLLRPYLPRGAYARTLSALITEKLRPNGLAVLVEMAASSFSNSQVRRELSDQEVLSDMSRALSATGMIDVGAPIRLEVPIRVEETGARYEGVLLLGCKRRQDEEGQPMGKFVVIKPEQRSVETTQTAGMVRAAAVSAQTTGATRIWMGYTTMALGSTSGPHHHGDCESGIYVIKGHARFRVGERLEEVQDVGPGDFIFVPPWTIHQEINLSETEPVEMIVVRDSQETLVYNVEVSS